MKSNENYIDVELEESLKKKSNWKSNEDYVYQAVEMAWRWYRTTELKNLVDSGIRCHDINDDWIISNDDLRHCSGPGIAALLRQLQCQAGCDKGPAIEQLKQLVDSGTVWMHRVRPDTVTPQNVDRDVEEKSKMFKVYDTVWIMEHNRPIEQVVFAVVESMDYRKTGTDALYHLVDRQVGAGWGNNEGKRYNRNIVFATKDELLQHVWSDDAEKRR